MFKHFLPKKCYPPKKWNEKLKIRKIYRKSEKSFSHSIVTLTFHTYHSISHWNLISHTISHFFFTCHHHHFDNRKTQFINLPWPPHFAANFLWLAQLRFFSIRSIKIFTAQSSHITTISTLSPNQLILPLGKNIINNEETKPRIFHNKQTKKPL